MFRPNASLPLRIVRTVFVPSGPLLLTLALVGLANLPDSVAKPIGLVSLAWFFCSLILVPALMIRAEGPGGSPGDDSGDDSRGGGGPDDRPSPAPDRGGGLPLPDAEQSSVRVRDHVRRKRTWLRRRAAREPEPARAPSRLSRRRT